MNNMALTPGQQSVVEEGLRLLVTPFYEQCPDNLHTGAAVAAVGAIVGIYAAAVVFDTYFLASNPIGYAAVRGFDMYHEGTNPNFAATKRIACEAFYILSASVAYCAVMRWGGHQYFS